MKILARLAPLAVALAALTTSAASQAGLVFEIQRINDHEAIVTGSGALDAQVPGYVVAFAGASASPGDLGPDPSSGDMKLGTVGVQSAYIRFNQTHFVIDFRDFVDNMPAGSALTGSLHITLDSEIWQPVGTTGNLYNEVGNNFLGTQLLGTYSIVGPSGGNNDVPEPGSIALLGAGLAGLAAVRRRKP